MVEVKSAAYIQSWKQKGFSKISFSIKKARSWSADINEVSKIRSRPADVYVFCLLAHMDKKTIDPLNLDQWRIFVLSRKEIDAYIRSQHSITLVSLKKFADELDYDGIKGAVYQR